MQVPPPTSYLDRRGKSFAYQVFGSGEPVVVIYHELNHHLDLTWGDPDWVDAAERLGDHARVIQFQQAGIGLSDSIDRVPTLEEQAADIAAVMDAERVEAATLYGVLSTAPAVLLFAAQHPDRTAGVVVNNPLPQGPRHEGTAGMAGLDDAQRAETIAVFNRVFDRWGEGYSLDAWDRIAPPGNRRMVGMLERSAASPAGARALYEAAAASDVRDILPQIQAPTRVLWHGSATMPPGPAKLTADLIDGATFHELPPSQPHWSYGEAIGRYLDHLVEMVSGAPAPERTRTQVATIVFTDIVGSTQLVVEHGDAGWSDLLRRHEFSLRQRAEAEGGRLVKMIGDGSMSVFTGPAAAVRAARAMTADATDLGFEVRAGVHTGECERQGDDVAGLAVHVAARIEAAAQPGEVLVSRSVSDLTGGSGLAYDSRGERELKGVPGAWELLVARAEDPAAVAVADEPLGLRRGDKMRLLTCRKAPKLARAAAKLERLRARRLTQA